MTIELNLSYQDGLACISMAEKKDDGKLYQYTVELNFPKVLVGNDCRQLLAGHRTNS